MTALEKTEIVILVLLTASVFALAPLFPSKVSIANGVLWLAALIFTQSLLRDIAILVVRKKSESNVQSESCFCVESILGLTVLLVGLVLFGVGINANFGLSPLHWSIVFAVVVTLNFLLKDWVIAWRPLALRREKNHLNIVVKW